MPRPAPLVALAGLLLAAPAAPADDALYTAVVARAEAEVRSHPGEGPQVVVTNRLRQGAAVQVVRDLGNGWLQIRPPDGSFSWINTRFVERIADGQPHWVVALRDVPVNVILGSDLRPNDRPPLISAQLTRGAQVRVVGTSLADDEGTWLRIEPPAGETRYVRADDVVKAAAPPAVAARPPEQAQPALAAQPGVAPRPPAAPSIDVEARWQQAMQAERAGQVAAAVVLYDQISVEATSRPDLAAAARDRAHWLRQAYNAPEARVVTPVATQQRQPEQIFTPTGAQRVEPGPARPAPERPVVPCPPGDQAASSFRPAPTPSNPWATPRSPEGHPSSGAGVLRRAGRAVEGRRTYVLESLQGYPLLYVTAQGSLDLEAFVDRKVELFGPAIYRGDLRANYMAAVRAQPLP
jgi:hypothetical protein